MATSTTLSDKKKEEKPAPKIIGLNTRVLRVALTIKPTSWAGAIPFTGISTHYAQNPTGKVLFSRMSDVCLGADIFATHLLERVSRKDASFEGKVRERYIFTLVPIAEFSGERSESLLQVEADLKNRLALEAFNDGTVFDNGSHFLVELRGQAHRSNANTWFTVC